MYNYHFPKDFIIGTATAAYQIEGGREHLDSCIWDDFAKIPGKVHNFEDGAIACDSYNRVDEDVALLKQLNVKAYRFSICLTRVINENGEVLQDGINYYKYLICKLKENNIMPFVTLYHWDLPSYLQEKYGGWIADETVQWFVKYCEVVFNAFKNDVPFYITINEPFCVCHLGYAYGCHAPGICDEKQQLKASFNILKAHGLVVNLYKKLGYTGKIGICVNINDVRGHENTSESVVRLFKNKGMWWYFMPVATGKFPEDAFAFYKEKGLIDDISEEDLKLMTTRGDFIGLNHYNPEFIDENENHHRHEEYEVNGLGWHVDSKSIYNVVKEMASYTDAEIYILENGYGSVNVDDVDVETKDVERLNYYKEYMIQVNKLVDEGVNLKGYFAWSLLDNYEWSYGYTIRFGLVHVDYKTQKRTIKDSGKFIKEVCEKTYKNN